MILWIGLVLFVSTNVDDVFVLLALFADASFRPRQIVLGQYLGMTALIAISLGVALGSTVIPLDYVGLLGVVPFALGMYKLVQLIRRRESDDPAPRAGASNVLAVATLTIANGSDNVGAYVPLFATRDWQDRAVLAAIFLLLTGVWCVVAHALVKHPRIGAPLRRYGHVMLPLALIALGLYIVYECEAVQRLL